MHWRLRPIRSFLASERSFTLLELLITVAIIAILAGMVLFAMYRAQETAKAQKTKALIAKLDAIIMASGSEVSIALDAAGLLEEADIRARVVSMPCWELFEAQSDDYKESVLPSGVSARVSVEAGATLGWRRYLGERGIAIGVDRFGASAPYTEIYQAYGLTPGHVADAVNSLLDD